MLTAMVVVSLALSAVLVGRMAVLNPTVGNWAIFVNDLVLIVALVVCDCWVRKAEGIQDEVRESITQSEGEIRGYLTQIAELEGRIAQERRSLEGLLSAANVKDGHELS